MRVLWFFVLLFICVSPLQAEVVDRIEAVVGDKVITSLDVKNLSSFYKQNPLQGIVDDYMIEEFCLKRGITVSEDEVDKYIQEVCRENHISRDELFEKVEESGVSRHYYKRKIELNIMRMKFIQKFIVPFVYITDKEIRDYYEVHKEDYARGKEVEIDMILFKKGEGELAKDVIENIYKGRIDFERAKELYSVKKDKPVFIPVDAFNEDVRKMIEETMPGGVCGPVEVKEGVYILKVLDKVGGGFVPLDKVKEDIREHIFRDKVSHHLNMWLKACRKEMQVRIIR